MSKYVKSDKNFIYEQNIKRTIPESIATMILKLWYKLLFLFIKTSEVEKKYKVSICAIFKDEAPYLREWIEFNRIVGVEHFYMYNNNSTDDYLHVLEDYIKHGIVTLVDWPYEQGQISAYKECIKKYSDETEWIAFIDIDEFIVPNETSNIYEYLRKFTNRGSVIAYWRMFGTSGLMNRDLKRCVTADFTVCWSKYCGTGKCFYNTRFGFNPDSKRSVALNHRFWATWHGIEIPPVNQFDKVCIGGFSVAKSDIHPIQINHYCLKSLDEYALKRKRGDAFYKENAHGDEYFERNEILCCSNDYSAYRYLIRLKNELNNK